MLAAHGADSNAVQQAGLTPEQVALTTLGYSGEHFDAKAQQQYLRARFYDPSNGRFNRLDPYAGNMQDPQSLHKYAYVHGDPIGNIDPSGLFSVTSSLAATSISSSLAQEQFEAGVSVIEQLDPENEGIKSYRQAQLAKIIATAVATGGVGVFFLVQHLRRLRAGQVRGAIDFQQRLIGQLADPRGIDPHLAILAREGFDVSAIRRASGTLRVQEIRRRFDLTSANARRRNIAYAQVDVTPLDAREFISISGSSSRHRPAEFVPHPQIRLFDTTDGVTRPGGHAFPRPDDSEALLLEEIARQLAVTANPRGVIRLFSERPVCTGCRHVIRQFEELFPDVRIVFSDGNLPGNLGGFRGGS